MAVELHGLGVVVLGVGEQLALYILAGQRPQNRLGGYPLVHVQGHRLDLKPGAFALAAPLQPGFVAFEGPGQHLGLGPGERPLTGDGQQLGQGVSRGGIWCRAQDRRQVRVVVMGEAWRVLDRAVRFQAGRRDVLAGGRVAEGGDGVAVWVRFFSAWHSAG